MGGRFENTGLQQWSDDAANNPAAPAGLNQIVTAANGQANNPGGRFADTGLAQWANEDGLVATSSSWYTGMNTAGTWNGWDNGFVQATFDPETGLNAAAEAGNLATYFGDGGTGVVTWDHETPDGRHAYKFGDIVEKGQVVGNVYDLYDENTANLSLLPWLGVEGDKQRRLFTADDPAAAMKAEVAGLREQNNKQAADALKARDFQGDVEERTEDIGDSNLTVAGAAGGGALLGAGLGSIVPGAGTAVGAGVGGLIGGAVGLVGGLLNKDELDEQAARAYEITALANEEHGTGAAVATGLQQWGQFSMQLSSPLTNLSHGITDVTEGQVGDGVSEFYRLDDKGERTRPLWAEGLSLGAALADGVLQFASAPTRALYLAQMGTVVGGESAGLALRGGEAFDPREGGFDNIFVDDDGNFDPVSGAAGILKIGVDAVQMGGWAGLARATAARTAATEAGERSVELAGRRFVLDESGKAVASRRTLALLAPSEQVAFVSATRMARTRAVAEGRAMTADDVYRAASNLANGSNRLKAAMVNGFGEGYEEAAQAVLEPISMDGKLSFADIANSFFYGAAAGVGMSLGATAGAASNDQRMMAQAYVLDTLRHDAEPDWEQFQSEWAGLSDSEKRVRASRTPADAQLTQQALATISRDHAASLVASGLDTAKALDAQRKKIDKELERATRRTDAYHVMSAKLDAGTVDVRGERIGDTAPAEAIEASAITIHRLLVDRLEGVRIQRDFLADRVAELSANPELVAELADAQATLAHTELMWAVGQNITADVADQLDRIYETGGAEALPMIEDLNRFLEDFFFARADVAAPEGAETADPAELRAAAAQFTTLLSSREPKLDSGSYLALLPRVSKELTAEQGDNLVQVNVDVLASINGDFDGDMLRAENQLVLSRERFLQARAGQLLGGVGSSVDIAGRNFEAELVAAVATGIRGEGQVRLEAEAALANIESAITHRYDGRVAPAGLRRALDEFRAAVLAGSAEAKTTLLDALAREGSQAITDRGREQLTNEWLWIGQVVRANLEAFDRSFRQVARPQDVPTETAEVADFTTPEGTNRRKTRATTDAQTLALFAPGNTLFRKFQKIHYSWFNSAVLEAARTEPADLAEMAAFYEQLGRNVTRSAIAIAEGRDTIAGRVLAMLDQIVEAALSEPSLRESLDARTARTVLANVKVKDVWFDGDQAVTDDVSLSLVQVLLKRALEADRLEHARDWAVNDKLQAKHARLGQLVLPNDAENDVRAQQAFLEVFGAMPFASSLSGVTGALAPHTTPEQWLANYVGLDAEGRRETERLFKNVPEYLDREQDSNMPYSLAEARTGAITPYRSMLDALMAVGRAELTFDASKPAEQSLGGRKARQSRQAMADFKTVHGLVRDALGRGATAERVQQMLAANPQQGKQILDMVPAAAANAVYELRDGELYVAPWLYETFAIKNPDEALAYFWKNLTLAQWNSLLGEKDEAGGRAYGKLTSRFQRLLYQLNREPGQPRLELLVRKLESAKSLDELFYWINTTPGMRGADLQAPFVPFVDDVAEFDPEAAGVWGTTNDSTDLRTAIATAKTAARTLRETMRFRQETAATDRQILDSIKRAHAGDPAATPLDHDYLRRLEAAVSTARELPRGFGPSAILALGRGVMRGFDAQSHDKGRTATSFEPLGEFQALMDAWGFESGLERLMEVLTAHSTRSVATNLGDVARFEGQAMDADGRTVEWAPMTVDTAIELLEDSRTAPLALALLTPKVLDLSPNGTMAERLVTDASLKDLLDDSHLRDLFRDDDEFVLDRSLRYLQLVDAKARTVGGNFDAMRAAHDLALSRTSGLGREATEDDLDRLIKQAYVEVAQVLQLVGRVQASPALRAAGTLEALRETALAELRDQRSARALPAFTDETGKVAESWVELTLTQLESQLLEETAALAERFEGEELTRQVEARQAMYAANEQRIRDALADDLTGQQLARFGLTGDETADAAARAQIVAYVRAEVNFPARAPEAGAAWSKLVRQLRAGEQVELTDTEWDTLSRAAMGVALADQVLRVASHVAVPPFPKGDPAISASRFFKYYDPGFSYLVTDLLSEGSPLAGAATWLHVRADQPTGEMSLDDAAKVLRRTVLNRADLGTWTPGLMSQIVEAHQRMDSAAAGQAIAAAGNGPKRNAVLAAATRRTGKVPTPELLTTVTLPAGTLAGRANLIAVQPAGHAEPTSMPVAQLDNRFVAAIRFDGEPVDLAAENLGFRWDGAAEANPYRYVALERLQRVAERKGATVVEIDFFHPDSQPAGPEWMHNAFFEGMSHHLIPDGAESLIATLWSDNGGMIGLDTQRPLDAGKKGLRAIQPFRRPRPGTRAEAEEHWTVRRDFAAMLRAKTEILASYDDGSGTVAPEYFNALYKHMKLAHIVVGRTLDGDPAAMTAEAVIAFQAANGRAAELPLTEARLVQLSPDVLRSMLGETGDQGVARVFDDPYLLNPDQVKPYTGVPASALDRFGLGWLGGRGTVADTELANVGARRALRVKTVLTSADRDARQQRLQFLDNAKARTINARYKELRDPQMARDSYVAVLRLAAGAIKAEHATFDFAAQGAPIAPRNTVEVDHSRRILESYVRDGDATGFARGWRVVDRAGATEHPAGVLSVDSLDAELPLEHRVVRDDIVLLELRTFERPEISLTQQEQRVERAARWLASTGATVALGSGTGAGDLRFLAAETLRSLGYVPVAGSRHLYEPAATSYGTQNERAYESTLTETRRLRPARNAVTFLATDPIGTDENAAVYNRRSRKLRDRKVLNNVLPSAGLVNYGLPLETVLDAGTYARTLTHLRTVTAPGSAERAQLEQMAGPDPVREMPVAEALDRFHARITNSASLVPEAGAELRVGDIIPFVHPAGRVVLYRHGMKLPKRSELDKLLATGGLNVALAKSEIESAATANDGVVRYLEPRAGYGFTVVLESELQMAGNKVQQEYNGMKYILVPPTSGSVLDDPPPVFANGTVVDLFSDAASSDSKEAFGGRVRSYRNALAFFQYDFTDDLVEFFFPGQRGDAGARTLTYDLLHRLTTVARDQGAEVPVSVAAAIAQANVAAAEMLAPFAAVEADRGVDPGWAERLGDADVSAQIARAVVLYLLTPGAQVDNVLKSAGFSHPRAAEDDLTTREVPGLFADLLNQGVDSELHAELIRRFDAQLYRGPDGSGFRLHPDWTVSMTTADGTVTRGYLQYGEVHSSGDNPLLDGQAYHLLEDQGVSAHNAMAAFASLGASTAHRALKGVRSFAKSFSRGGGVAKTEAGDSVWQMLTALPDEPDSVFADWRRETPAETARRVAGRKELVGYHQPLDDTDWSDAERAEYRRTRTQVLETLNLFGEQTAMVDTWVRQQLGRPHEVVDGVARGVITGRDAVEIVREVLALVRKGDLPTAGGNVPLIDVNHLTTIYMANVNREAGAWAPTAEHATRADAVSWDAWVETALGTAFSPERRFDRMYLLAVDGMMHGYQGATISTRNLPVSSDQLVQNQLMDPETNRMLVSVSEDENLLAADATLFNATVAELEDIVSAGRLYAPGTEGDDPASARGRQRIRLEQWRNEHDVPRQVGETMRSVRAAGHNFIGHTTTTSAFFRSWMNLRVGNTLFNATLAVYAPLEAFYRRTINTLGNVAAGESTGWVGGAQVRLRESLGDGWLDKVATHFGWEQVYTGEQHRQLNQLVDALATRPEFKAIIYKELMFQYPSVPGIGRIEKWLERYAKFGAKLQDPAYGMLPRDLARIYVETALRRIAAAPTGDNVYSVDRLLAELRQDPAWLMRQDREAHSNAIAAIAQIRSVKPNILSMAFRGAVTPLTENDKPVFNALGNTIQVLTAFQNFWSGFAINITGLQGAADFAAMLVDGREKKITRRMQAALRGETFDPEGREFFDMTEALEGLDLADSIIRGGITHTGLFAFGLLAGGLGLGGDDEEEKFRRRQAELQGAGFIADPRKLQYDFRNRDALFLDWLPLGLDSLFKVNPEDPNSRSMAQMNWVLRSFLSPVIGFERFYRSGDFGDVIAGFGDAIGSHPVVNAQLWGAATETAAALNNEANDLAGTGKPEDQAAAGHLLITAVGILERTVLENSMVNMIYVGTDRYDRDPYAMPKLDSDGNPQVDVRGNAVSSDALKPYRDPETGEVKEGYYDRDDFGAQLRVLTENRFGLALVGSLFTGLTGGGFLTGSDLFRRNMQIKERQVELQSPTMREAEALVLGQFLGEMADGGVYGRVTESEAAQIIWNSKPEGAFWPSTWVEKQAKIWSAQQGVAALSFLDEAGREHLTEDGAAAIFEGLRMGTISLKPTKNGFGLSEEPVDLAGVYISPDMREKVLARYMRRLQREGQELGLTQQQAASRMKRIVFGPFDDPEAREGSLYNIVWTKDIPFTDTMKYNQLNTTYVVGPSGYPMATGFTRDGLMGALGLKPLNRTWSSADTGLGLDGRLNATDTLAGINTGMRALEARPESFEIPTTEEEIRAAAEKIADAIGELDLGQLQAEDKKSGGGYYGGYGGYGYGGGGGGGYSSGGYFTRMYTLPFVNAPYGNDIPFINTSNPYVRRANIRRERVWSERGRLNQWQ